MPRLPGTQVPLDALANRATMLAHAPDADWRYLLRTTLDTLVECPRERRHVYSSLAGEACPSSPCGERIGPGAEAVPGPVVVLSGPVVFGGSVVLGGVVVIGGAVAVERPVGG